MLNIAQIGIGYWGPNLLRNLMANKQCKVTLVSDLDANRRDYVHRLYPAFTECPKNGLKSNPKINGLSVKNLCLKT